MMGGERSAATLGGAGRGARGGVRKLILAASATGAGAVTSADCWVGGWTPEICCSAPGAKGNPLCWDHVYTYDKCCTETEEGIQFNLRRRNFVTDMVRRGATVHFDIRHVSGGRTGAVAARALSTRSTVLRVPATQVYSLKSVPAALAEAADRHSCDAHATLALGLALERVNPNSVLTDWIRLLPMSFANVLWFSTRQLQLVNATFFAYVVQNWFGDLQCMQRAANEIPPGAWRGRQVDYEDLRWALSVVKTRGFAFEGTRESTMLIPLADFLNHNMVASVRTATLAEDALRFVATRNIMPGEELCIDYAQASNLEFLVRYGFRVEDNPYGGRQFDLGGEPMQAHCPSYILRYDTPDVIENATVDCHRQARYLSFEQQFGTLQSHEQLREDRYIYHAIEEACLQLLSMLEAPKPLSDYETASSGADGITSVLVREIRAERVLLQRCVHEFQSRQREVDPRPVPGVLAEPLARIWGQSAGGEASPEPPIDDQPMPSSQPSSQPSEQWSMGGAQGAGAAGGPGRVYDAGFGRAQAAGGTAYDSRAQAAGAAYDGRGPAAGAAYDGRGPASAAAYDGRGQAAGAAYDGRPQAAGAAYDRRAPAAGAAYDARPPTGGRPGDGRADGGSAPSSAGFSAKVDRSRVDQLLQKLQQGGPLS